MIKTKSFLPDDWNIIKLGKFVINEKGKKSKNLSKSKSKKFNIPYIDIQSFEKGIINSWTDGEGIRECFDTDFLMVWDGSRSGLVGKGMNGALGSTLVRIKFPKVNNLYAYYFLKSKYYEINKKAKGSGTPHVDPDLLWNYDFPIAPLKTQERIVSFLNDEFKKITLIEDNLNITKKKLKYFRQSLMNNAFLGRISDSWRKKNKCGNIDQLLSKIKIEYEEIYLEEKKLLNKKDKKKPKKFFRKIKKIGKDINIEDRQLKLGNGYDHCWVLNDYNKKSRKIGEVNSNKTKINMEIFSDLPGVQLYTGNFLDGSLNSKKDLKYINRSGFCLETQFYPNSPNNQNFPSTKLEPGKKFYSKTSFKFSIIE